MKDNKWVLSYGSSVERMALAPDGSLWLAETVYESPKARTPLQLVGVGFSIFDGENWHRQFILPDKSGITGKRMLFSSDGSLWVAPFVSGEGENGVYRYNHGQWSHYTIQNGLSGNSVKAIYTTKDGALWFVTEGGLTRYDNAHK